MGLTFWVNCGASPDPSSKLLLSSKVSAVSLHTSPKLCWRGNLLKRVFGHGLKLHYKHWNLKDETEGKGFTVVAVGHFKPCADLLSLLLLGVYSNERLPFSDESLLQTS